MEPQQGISRCGSCFFRLRHNMKEAPSEESASCIQTNTETLT